uniref:Calpain catalytic domain-containing protein n=1 Tax=viral metagenome TaxID=1070528 RepID=A0A6C0JPT7_9ZZZZ
MCPDSFIQSESSPLKNVNEYELKIIKKSSLICGIVYYPIFKISDFEKYDFYPKEVFRDKKDAIKLDRKSLKNIVWKRFSDVYSDPKMIVDLNPFSITQIGIGDCNIIASITCCANYERLTGIKLITNLIFPQVEGIPVYNPSGVYVVKMFLNGFWRMVVIDDTIPYHGRTKFNDLLPKYNDPKVLFSLDNSIMCRTTIEGELWPTIIEKGYLKFLGGLRDEGTLPSSDLHRLTGWIPERIKTMNISKNVYDRLESFFQDSKCMATIGSKDVPRSIGLAGGHAYSVLNMKSFKGIRLFYIRNPWGKFDWKGKYSRSDDDSWTEELQKELDFFPFDKDKVDLGDFWMEINDVKKYFTSINVCYNPAIYEFFVTTHDKWKLSDFKYKGSLENTFPLYSITFTDELSENSDKEVFIFFNRHILDFVDFHQSSYFVIYMIRGSNIKETEKSYGHIVSTRFRTKLNKVSFFIKTGEAYYEPKMNLYYTLNVYSHSEFKLEKIEREKSIF